VGQFIFRWTKIGDEKVFLNTILRSHSLGSIAFQSMGVYLWRVDKYICLAIGMYVEFHSPENREVGEPRVPARNSLPQQAHKTLRVCGSPGFMSVLLVFSFFFALHRLPHAGLTTQCAHTLRRPITVSASWVYQRDQKDFSNGDLINSPADIAYFLHGLRCTGGSRVEL
jgi:hypothetical protein